MADRLVGLDISSRRLLAVEVIGSNTRHPKISQVHSVDLPEGAARDSEVTDIPAVSNALQQLWREGGFKTKRVVLGVGNQRVLVRDHQVPVMPMAQLREALPYQVADLLPVPVTETILDYYPLAEVEGSDPPEMSGLLVAAIRENVEANVAAVEDAGFKVVAVDLSPFAMVRALARANQLEGTKSVVMIGDRTTFIVVATDGVPQFVRIVPAGGDTITDAIELSAEVSFEEAEEMKYLTGLEKGLDPEFSELSDATLGALRNIIGAVRSTNNYFLGNHPNEEIDGVVVVGRDVRVPGLVQALGEHVQLPAVVGAPLQATKLVRDADTEVLGAFQPELAVPLGLTL